MLINNKFNLGNCMGLIILHLALRTDTPQLEGRQLGGRAGDVGGGNTRNEFMKNPVNFFFELKIILTFPRRNLIPK